MKHSAYRAILKKQKMSFYFFLFLYKTGEQEGKTGPVWGLVPVGRGEYKERMNRRSIMYLCMKVEK
jgi:hypothetical protein